MFQGRRPRGGYPLPCPKSDATRCPTASPGHWLECLSRELISESGDNGDGGERGRRLVGAKGGNRGLQRMILVVEAHEGRQKRKDTNVRWRR